MKLRVPLSTIATTVAVTGSIVGLADESSAFTISAMRVKGAVSSSSFVNQASTSRQQEQVDSLHQSWMASSRKRIPLTIHIPGANRLKRSLAVSATQPAEAATPLPINMPYLGPDGMYEVNSPEQHAALLQYAHDKLVILKVYAPWCRACKALEPKFLSFVHDPKFNDNIPIVWASLSIQHSKAFVKSLGVLALPTVQFYVGGKLTETFGCGPSKVPILKRKLVTLINDHVDPRTRTLKQAAMDEVVELAEQAGMRVKEAAGAATYATSTPTGSSSTSTSSYTKDYVVIPTDSTTEPLVQPVSMAEAERKILLNIPYFREMSLPDFNALVEKKRVLAFEPGHIIVRQGRPGRLFYVIMSGEVEIMQQTGSEDPLINTGYLGTVINRLGPYDYFGERSLITGEPRGATVRATEPITIWAFDTDDFPESSVLSSRSKGLATTSALMSSINDKYGIDVTTQSLQAITKQIRDSSYANQVRGSVNNPYMMLGVDDVILSQDDDEIRDVPTNQGQRLQDSTVYGMPQISDDRTIFALITKFQAVQHVKTCFEYIETTRARWGDDNIRKRRSLLVQRLTPSQQVEFTSNFHLIDSNSDGRIELLEIKRVLDSIVSIDTDHYTAKKDDDEFLSNLMELGPKQQHTIDGQPYLTYEDYMGLMAEATFYQLFRSIFSQLDPNNTGYVKAYELDRVLCGVRDLISDDRKSVIDVEDQDMSIDYEQFARMLLGTTLV